MIEMQWVKLATDYPVFEANKPRFEYATNLGGFAYVLQFREVIELREDGSVKVATNWQDVEIGRNTQ